MTHTHQNKIILFYANYWFDWIDLMPKDTCNWNATALNSYVTIYMFIFKSELKKKLWSHWAWSTVLSLPSLSRIIKIIMLLPAISSHTSLQQSCERIFLLIILMTHNNETEQQKKNNRYAIGKIYKINSRTRCYVDFIGFIFVNNNSIAKIIMNS